MISISKYSTICGRTLLPSSDHVRHVLLFFVDGFSRRDCSYLHPSFLQVRSRCVSFRLAEEDEAKLQRIQTGSANRDTADEEKVLNKNNDATKLL